MPKILLLPLDERPCNYLFPNMLASSSEDIELLLPPKSLLGAMKQAADISAVAQWLRENFSSCDYAIISIDMLVYGGIVPSRLHQLTPQQCLDRLSVLTQLHAAYPHIRIFAFTLIMRAPAYNSSLEEPDYYAVYGERLCRFGALRDRQRRGLSSIEEKSEFLALENALPPEILHDFCNRRKTNHAVNLASVSLLNEGVLDFLVVPLDDCAPYGWAAAERGEILSAIRQNGLGRRAYSYCGADEVGCILLARAANHSRRTSPGIFLQYSSVCGPFVIPKYEDRPLGENLRWQIAAAGGRTVPSGEFADMVLMVNSPTVGGEQMSDAGHDGNFCNIAPACLPDFIHTLRAMLQCKPVLLADVALANGADTELMKALAQEDLLAKLTSYSGWNTAANAAGTCIAHGMICADNIKKGALFTTHRILEDWLYMSCIRRRAAAFAERQKITLSGSGEQDGLVTPYILRELKTMASQLSLPQCVSIQHIALPWHRLFEIELQISVV
ncbi:MAG: DUF4127 family protein [Clostridiales bacterium]|nr:DUF4127 family protein [Clostridiales bacterium]